MTRAVQGSSESESGRMQDRPGGEGSATVGGGDRGSAPFADFFAHHLCRVCLRAGLLVIKVVHDGRDEYQVCQQEHRTSLGEEDEASAAELQRMRDQVRAI